MMTAAGGMARSAERAAAGTTRRPRGRGNGPAASTPGPRRRYRTRTAATGTRSSPTRTRPEATGPGPGRPRGAAPATPTRTPPRRPWSSRGKPVGVSMGTAWALLLPSPRLGPRGARSGLSTLGRGCGRTRRSGAFWASRWTLRPRWEWGAAPKGSVGGFQYRHVSLADYESRAL